MTDLEQYRNQGAFIIGDLVAGALKHDSKFTVIDGGARDAFTQNRWTKLPQDKIAVHGFEPDGEECLRLNAEAKARGLSYTFHPTGIWSRRDSLPFFVTAEPGGSSCFQPNTELVSRYLYLDGKPLSTHLTVTKQVALDVMTLDEWVMANGSPSLDFIKLNIQGAELEVLKGAERCLDEVMGLQLEMSFSQTYLQAPLFADIDTFARQRKFVFFDFLAPNITGRVNAAVRFDNVTQAVGIFRWPSRQIFEGHFLYLRDPIGEQWRNFSEGKINKVLKLAAFAESYGQIEFAFELLHWLCTSLGGENHPETHSVLSLHQRAIEKYQSVFR